MNATTRLGDRCVIDTGEALLKFMAAITGEDEMRVAIDEPGSDEPPIEIDLLGGLKSSRQFAFPTDKRNAVVRGGNRAILNQPDTGTLGRQGREMRAARGLSV